MTPEKKEEILMDIHARVKSIEDRLLPIAKDHEDRIRVLESARHYVLGAAAAVATVASLLATWAKNVITGGGA